MAATTSPQPAPDPRVLARAHDEFRAHGRVAAGVRPLIAESWRRCVVGGLDPAHPHPRLVPAADLAERRQGHPLADLRPALRSLLMADDRDSGVLVAITDVDGTLLWVEGDHAVRSRAERMSFAAGACWSEREAGTNAPGTALALGRPVRVRAAEHLADAAAAWSCAAVPVHDPSSGAVVGVVDLTGGDAVAGPHVLSVVRAAVATLESQLALRAEVVPRPAPSPPPSAPGVRTLSVLGQRAGLLSRPGGEQRLGLRHTEVLALLATAPAGRTGEQLAHLLHERPVSSVTVRAGLSRLRRLLPDVPVRSQPYRVDRLVTDAQEVSRLLGRGRVADAVTAYAGPVLPRSTAPGVVDLRDELHGAVRTAVLRSGNGELVTRLARGEHSRLDVGLWRAAVDLLPAGSPDRDAAVAHLRRVEVDLA